MDELRVKIGVNESSKKKLVSRTLAGHVEKWQIKNWQRADSQKVEGGGWRGNGGEKDQNCNGDSTK